mmetsp:Transcript_936/g.2673  ORF Transcript_936/g.2673 Transcript_936/m.2673 type:complete len:442 (-) Transcript_936:124-1449(-)
MAPVPATDGLSESGKVSDESIGRTLIDSCFEHALLADSGFELTVSATTCSQCITAANSTLDDSQWRWRSRGVQSVRGQGFRCVEERLVLPSIAARGGRNGSPPSGCSLSRCSGRAPKGVQFREGQLLPSSVGSLGGSLGHAVHTPRSPQRAKVAQNPEVSPSLSAVGLSNSATLFAPPVTTALPKIATPGALRMSQLLAENSVQRTDSANAVMNRTQHILREALADQQESHLSRSPHRVCIPPSRPERKEPHSGAAAHARRSLGRVNTMVPLRAAQGTTVAGERKAKVQMRPVPKPPLRHATPLYLRMRRQYEDRELCHAERLKGQRHADIVLNAVRPPRRVPAPTHATRPRRRKGRTGPHSKKTIKRRRNASRASEVAVTDVAVGVLDGFEDCIQVVGERMLCDPQAPRACTASRLHGAMAQEFTLAAPAGLLSIPADVL